MDQAKLEQNYDRYKSYGYGEELLPKSLSKETGECPTI